MSENERRLCRHWIHSEEEGEGDQVLVFRTASYPFSLRRMPRSTLTLEADGSVKAGEPDRADRHETTLESWSLKGDQLTITGTSRLSGVYQVIAVDDLRLVLRRVQGEN